MDVSVQAISITDVRADVIVVNLFKGVQTPGGATGVVDQALGGAISRAVARGEFAGSLGETITIDTMGRLPAQAVVVVGLGPAAEFNYDRARHVAGAAARQARKAGAGTMATIVHGAGVGGLEAARAARATTEGTIMGLYRFDRYRTSEQDGPKHEVERVIIAERDTNKAHLMEAGVRRGQVLARAVNMTRDLVVTPANDMTPTRMAEAAAEMARGLPLDLQVLERADMERLGMGALLGVAQGSAEPPKLIVLHYRPQNGRRGRPIALVGKGITFDSGGISLKPGEGMGDMKMDMAGGAAVLGAMRAIAELGAGVEVYGIVPATENMPSGSAQRPGDVVRAMNGKTIEIISTDAEGRLILADAVSYANTLGVGAIVDIATLTGACVVALGNHATGLISNHDGLAEAVIHAGAEAGERIWRLPLFDEYKDQMKSDIADIKNTGGRAAGTITGGYFIGYFAGDTPWVHLDIAGTAWRSDKDYGEWPKGATGVGVRTLTHLVLDYTVSA